MNARSTASCAASTAAIADLLVTVRDRIPVGLPHDSFYRFIETLVHKETKELAVKWDDELVKADPYAEYRQLGAIAGLPGSALAIEMADDFTEACTGRVVVH